MASDNNARHESGLHRHTEQIKEEYPKPLSWLLVELAEFNREKWLAEDSPRKNTIGAEEVRETGLTTNEQEWAAKIADRLEKADEWACDKCRVRSSTCTRGLSGPALCNECAGLTLNPAEVD